MKTVHLLSGILLAASLVVAFGQPKRKPSTSEFMRQKLGHTQRVLEGLALEDFNLIGNEAKRLSSMSQESDWRVFNNPDYEEQSLLFRREVNKLAKAADAKDLDAATLAYVRVTMSCVDCHKFVRGKLLAKN